MQFEANMKSNERSNVALVAFVGNKLQEVEALQCRLRNGKLFYK
jgi:hypothetical protein